MIRRLVLDVLKPHEPGMVELTNGMHEKLDIEGVTATLIEMDEEVRTVRVVIEGENLNLDRVASVITDLGASIHSIDQVSCGDRTIDDQPIRQR